MDLAALALVPGSNTGARRILYRDRVIPVRINRFDGSNMAIFSTCDIVEMRRELQRLGRVVEEVANSVEPPWVEDTHRRWRRYRLSELARTLWAELAWFSIPREVWDSRRFTPYVEAGLRQVGTGAGGLLGHMRAWRDSDLRDPEIREATTKVFESIRSDCASPASRSAQVSMEETFRKNFATCRKQLLRVFRVCEEPIVVRLNLLLKADGRQGIQSQRSEAHYTKFRKALGRQAIDTTVLWHAGKRANDLDYRVHYQFLVLADGRGPIDPGALAQGLGNYWVQRCVGSAELASYESHFIADIEQPSGIATRVHRQNEGQLMALRNMMIDLCRHDELLLLPKEFTRNFHPGQAVRVLDALRSSGVDTRREAIQLASCVLR